jgi:hypothetical protein
MIELGKGQDGKTLFLNVTSFEEFGLLIGDEKNKKMVGAFYTNNKYELLIILKRALAEMNRFE